MKLLRWSTPFAKHLLADPQAYSITPQQAASFAAKQQVYAERLYLTRNPVTRSPSNIFAKDGAREAMVAEARALARIIRASPTVTQMQRFLLGLTIDKPKAQAIEPSDTPPQVEVESVLGKTVRVRLRDRSAVTNSGKAQGMAGAAVFVYLGETPPPTSADWRQMGSTSRTRLELNFAWDLPAGTKVWITAAWLNPRLQYGAMAEPVWTHLGYAAAVPVTQRLAA